MEVQKHVGKRGYHEKKAQHCLLQIRRLLATFTKEEKAVMAKYAYCESEARREESAVRYDSLSTTLHMRKRAREEEDSEESVLASKRYDQLCRWHNRYVEQMVWLEGWRLRQLEDDIDPVEAVGLDYVGWQYMPS